MKLETAQKIHEDCHGAPGDCSVCPLNTRPDYGHSYCGMVSMLRRAPEPVCPECKGRGWTLRKSPTFTYVEVWACGACNRYTSAEATDAAYDAITEALGL